MSLRKLFTALRGGFNEAVENVNDGQALRILDQELRDAKAELVKCDQNLTSIMAKRKLAEKKVASLESDVATYTDHAIKASEAGDQPLALECSDRVLELEQTLSMEKELLTNFADSESALKQNIQTAKTNVRRMEQQIEQVKATESVQKAQIAVSSRHMGANSNIKTALDSLERVKSKQKETAAKLEAADELAQMETGDSLDSKLKAAGISPGGQVSAADKLSQMLASKK